MVKNIITVVNYWSSQSWTGGYVLDQFYPQISKAIGHFFRKHTLENEEANQPVYAMSDSTLRALFFSCLFSFLSTSLREMLARRFVGEGASAPRPNLTYDRRCKQKEVDADHDQKWRRE